MILGGQSDEITLGSILPDMLIDKGFNHCEAHSKGSEIYCFLKLHQTLLDFRKAVLTHGFVPKGLDYYGDEKYLDYEKGYCFEKARPFVLDTVEACNIPPEMGWWKAHNIIEMGIELLVSSSGDYSERIKNAFANRRLVTEIDEMLRELWKSQDIDFGRRVKKFAGLIEMERAGAISLAKKYQLQMQHKHQVGIDTKKVARLIERAAESVCGDLQDFFETAAGFVKDNIHSLVKQES
ncbi:MAG: hypothetical protein PHV56_06600 [Clostridia bacterium]|nr:hypothetical protein [Clostridia bacterium]